MSDFLTRFKLDKHHKIERFGVLLSLCSVLMIVLVGSIFVKYNADRHKSLSGKVLYTQSFTSSLTKSAGTVSNVWVNKSATKAFVLLKFTNPDKISLDANTYQMFLTAVDTDLEHKELKSNPAGCIYMLGSTGYMGVYLSNAKGFQPQILKLVVRANDMITSTSSDNAQSNFSDSSFNNFDQFTVYFNPGGSEHQYADFLESDNLIVADMYEECVSRDAEAKNRELLQSDLSQMQVSLNKINEYTRQLSAYVTVPDAPEIIRGDSVTADEDGVLRLKTNSAIAKGFNFDWQDGSIKDGYLSKLAGSESVQQYLTNKANEVSVIPSVSESLRLMKYYKTDGTLLDKTSSSSTASVDKTETQAKSIITALETAWSEYYALKQTYQCTDLKALVYLEYDKDWVGTDFTVNTSDTVLKNW